MNRTVDPTRTDSPRAFPASTTSTPVDKANLALDPSNRDQPAMKLILINAPCGFCGYNLRGLAGDSKCPECGTAIANSVNQTQDAQRSRVHKRWSAIVLLGLVAMLILCPSQIWVALEMRFGDSAFGSATRLNVPGPKVWATTLVQRSLGYRPEWLGVQGTWLTLLGLAAVFCVTMPRVDLEGRPNRVRLLARWMPPLLVGGFFGFLMNAEYLYESDVAVGKYALFGIIGVELPCSLVLMIYLANIAATLGRGSIATLFQRAAVAQAACMIAGIAMAFVAKDLNEYRTGMVVQVWSALYGAACIITALLSVGAFIRLGVELCLLSMPTRWREALK